LEFFRSRIARGPTGRIQARLPRVFFVGQTASGGWYGGQDLSVSSQMDEGDQDNRREQNWLFRVDIQRCSAGHKV